MKCCKCKHLDSGVTDYGPYNEYSLFGFSYFFEFYEEDCPYIDDNYNLTEAGKEAEKVF